MDWFFTNWATREENSRSLLWAVDLPIVRPSQSWRFSYRIWIGFGILNIKWTFRQFAQSTLSLGTKNVMPSDQNENLSPVMVLFSWLGSMPWAWAQIPAGLATWVCIPVSWQIMSFCFLHFKRLFYRKIPLPPFLVFCWERNILFAAVSSAREMEFMSSAPETHIVLCTENNEFTKII